MAHWENTENSPLVTNRPARANGAPRGILGASCAVVLAAVAVMAAPVTASASLTSKVTVTVSGALSGTISQSPALGCMDGASPSEAIFAMSGNLKGGQAGAAYELVAETGNTKPSTWTKFYPKTIAHLGFSEDGKTTLGWEATSGKLTLKAKSGTVDAKFLPSGKGRDLTVKASWSC